MFYVYLIRNLKTKRTYIGYTKDLRRRIGEHQNKNPELIYYEAYKNETDAKERKKEEKIEVPAKFKGLVEEIEKMSVLDLAELVKILEKKFGVSAAAPVMAAAPAAGGAPAAEEKSV